MERPVFTFRQAQSAFDLISHLQSFDDERLMRVGGDALVRIVRECACRFERQTDAACFEALATSALDAAEESEIAVALLVANALQQGLWADDTAEFAEAAVERVCNAPRSLRTAVLRGLDTVQDFTNPYEQAVYLVPNEDRLTRPMDQILPSLCKIARNMDQSTRSSVAAADYGDRTDEHLRALNEVLSTADCRFPDGEMWFPSEVVELVAHVRSTPGFVPCTALLLANALPVMDHFGWFEFRWENLAVEYNALPDSVRPTILAGIRYLYEEDTTFLQHSPGASWDPVLAPGRMIHLVDLPED